MRFEDEDYEMEDELIALLVEERPSIDESFAAELDSWASKGFPLRSAPRPARTRGERAAAAWRAGLERLRATPPRRILLPVGAVATVAVVGAVAVSQVGELSEGDDDAVSMIASEGERDTGLGRSGLERGEEQGLAPFEDLDGSGGAASEAAPAAGDDQPFSTQYELDLPSPTADESVASGSSTAGFGTDQRQVIQSVDLDISTTAEEFRSAANEVYAIADSHDGFVKSSSVTGGEPGVENARPGRASFQLLIPDDELSSTLEDLSALGNVISRTDGTDDVTGQFNNTEEDIAQLRTARSELLGKIAELEEPSPERADLKAQLRAVERQLTQELKRLDNIEDKVHRVPVDVTLIGDAPEDTENSGWDIDEAIDDAGRVLEVIGGVAVISGAVLLPLALVAGIAGLLISSSRRRGRERALDE